MPGFRRDFFQAINEQRAERSGETVSKLSEGEWEQYVGDTQRKMTKEEWQLPAGLDQVGHRISNKAGGK